uniref:Uncharacterized protein n=1 Tax=Desertifilum tharense IPPAS B-1220 TaxID=1781255 RepID=A0ACD5GMU3_9CYAN
MGGRRELGVRSWGLGKKRMGGGGMGGWGECKVNWLLFSISTRNTATRRASYGTSELLFLLSTRLHGS